MIWVLPWRPGIHERHIFKKEKYHERRKQENRKDRAGSKAGSAGSEADRVVGAGDGQGRRWDNYRKQLEIEPFLVTWLSYDATIKVSHLLKHRDLLAVLRRTNCAFVTSAIESLDDAVLAKLDKGHTRADFLEAVGLARAIGLPLAPTFIPFHPWTTMESYRDFLRTLVELDLSTQIAPIQLAIRLLIPEGSLLLELPEIGKLVDRFDGRALYYPWRNADATLDALCGRLQETIKREEKRRTPRAEIFRQIWDLAETGEFPDVPMESRATIPYLTEHWYC